MLTTSVYEKACVAGFSHRQGHCLLQDAAVKSEGKCNAVYMHRKYGTQNHRLEVSLSLSHPPSLRLKIAPCDTDVCVLSVLQAVDHCVKYYNLKKEA